MLKKTILAMLHSKFLSTANVKPIASFYSHTDAVSAVSTGIVMTIGMLDLNQVPFRLKRLKLDRPSLLVARQRVRACQEQLLAPQDIVHAIGCWPERQQALRRQPAV